MSAIPTEYPVLVSDGVREYEVFDASAYNDAVFGAGHRPVIDQASAADADAEPAADADAEPAAE